jgi:hypothetical protein
VEGHGIREVEAWKTDVVTIRSILGRAWGPIEQPHRSIHIARQRTSYFGSYAVSSSRKVLRMLRDNTVQFGVGWISGL